MFTGAPGGGFFTLGALPVRGAGAKASGLRSAAQPGESRQRTFNRAADETAEQCTGPWAVHSHMHGRCVRTQLGFHSDSATSFSLCW